MVYKNETLIRESHERLMKEFMKEIRDSISNIQEPIVENRPEVRENDSGWFPATDGVPAACLEEHSGPDKLNEIRNEVAATQPTGILNPDKQSELMEIIKHRSEDFERELRRIVSSVDELPLSAVQRFRDELRDNAQKELAAKKYRFAS